MSECGWPLCYCKEQCSMNDGRYDQGCRDTRPEIERLRKDELTLWATVDELRDEIERRRASPIHPICMVVTMTESDLLLKVLAHRETLRQLQDELAHERNAHSSYLSVCDSQNMTAQKGFKRADGYVRSLEFALNALGILEQEIVSDN